MLNTLKKFMFLMMVSSFSFADSTQITTPTFQSAPNGYILYKGQFSITTSQNINGGNGSLYTETTPGVEKCADNTTVTLYVIINSMAGKSTPVDSPILKNYIIPATLSYDTSNKKYFGTSEVFIYNGGKLEGIFIVACEKNR